MGTFNIVGGFTSKDTVDEFKGYSNSYNPTPDTDDDDFFSDFTEEKTKSVDDELRNLFGEPVKADIIYTDKDGVEYTQDTLKTEIERAKKEEGVDRETVREWLKSEGLSDKFPEYNKTIGEHLGDFGNILKKRAGEVGGVVRDVGTGLTAGVAEGVVNLADLSDQALDATLGEAIRKIGTSIDPNFEFDRSGIREAFAGDRKLIEEAVKAIADEESLATKTGQLAGELGVTSLIPAGGVAKVGERLSKIPGGTKVVEALSKITPEIGKKIGGLAVRGAEEGAKFGAVAEGTPEAVETGAKVGAVATPVMTGIGTGLSKTVNALFPKKSLDDLVGEISQAKKKDIAKIKEGLSQLDTKGVKTYEDLSNNINSKISEIGKKQDKLLPKENIFDIDDFVTRVGDRQANYVKNALKDLEEVGLATDDLALLEKVDNLKGKVKISIKDINDLARFYGSEFKNKTFTKLGDPKSSLSASRFENTRKGLKDVSRSVLDTNESKILDSEMSNLFKTKEAIDKVDEAVFNLMKKVKERGLGEEVGRLVGRGLDIASLGTIRGAFTSVLPSNIGNKVMNALDIESNLVKNLKLLEKLTKDVDKVDKALSKEQVIKNIKSALGELFSSESATRLGTKADLEFNQ